MTRFRPSFLAAAFLVSILGSCLIAAPQITPTIGPFTGTLTTTGATGQIGVAGYATCAVVISTASGSPTFSVTPQGSNDGGSTWNTVTSIGAITTTPSNTSGAIAPYGLTNFRLNVGSLSGGTLNYTVTCGVAGALTTGAVTAQLSPIPLPVSIPTCAGAPNAPCVQVTGSINVVTSQATCPAAPNAPCAQITGPVTITGLTNPLPVTTPVPLATCPGAPTAPCVQITGQPTVAVSAMPGPAITSSPGGIILVQNVQANASPYPTSSPGGFYGTAQLHYGTGGAIYADAYPDSIPTPAAVNGGATSNQLFASASATQNVYIWHMGVQCTATCASLLVNIVLGTTATCGSNTLLYYPQAITGPATAGNTTMLWGSNTTSNQTGVGGISAVPLVAPTGDNVCTKFAAATTWTGTAQAFGVVTIH